MNISGKTKVYAVIGHPVAHSLSPVMHNANFAANGDDAVYVAFDVAPDRVVEAVHSLHALGCGGLSVTIPHKEVLFRGIKLLDESATLAGAVNTVEFSADGPKGYNTDGEGFVKSFHHEFGPMTGKQVAVLGNGGSARSVAIAAIKDGASEVTIVGRDFEKAAALANDMKTSPAIAYALGCTPADAIKALHMIDRIELMVADVVVNATPIGMKKNDVSIFSSIPFKRTACAMDLIYTFPETQFMKAAKAGGSKTANGLGMLLHQGAKQYEIWTGKKANLDAMRTALEKAVYGK